MPDKFQFYEKFWGRNARILPHYKYVARPIYKALGGNANPLISVPVTFFVMDYLFHQVLGGILDDFKKGINLNTFKPSLLESIPWLSLCWPIALKKYAKNESHGQKAWGNKYSIILSALMILSAYMEVYLLKKKFNSHDTHDEFYQNHNNLLFTKPLPIKDFEYLEDNEVKKEDTLFKISLSPGTATNKII